MDGKSEERKLLDYQTHMEIIAPWLAAAFVIEFTAHHISKMAEEGITQFENKDFRMLDELHHLTSGVKAFATDCAYIGNDEMRQSCGGAGFTMASGIAQIWADTSPMPTFEGVNVVMYQQSARYLFKQINEKNKGKTKHGFF